MSQMLLAGVTSCRLDLTWGSLQFHQTSLRNLATAMRATKCLCSVMIDSVGREIVVRLPAKEDSNGWMVLEKSPLNFVAGQEVIITTDPATIATSSLLPVNNSKFPSLVQPGNILHVGRFLATGAEAGSLYLQVQSSTVNEIRCIAQNDATLVGVLTILVSHRQFALDSHAHDLNRDLPLLSEHDTECLRTLGAEFEIDFLCLSYCNSIEDIWSARQSLDTLGLTQTKIIAKVERKAAIHNFDDIVAAADGVLFSRGNLGLDFEPEEMALLQKDCISRCNLSGKPIIVTRFVDTMVNTPRPTRAEATDVANAVLDGLDAVLLGAESLRGAYPVITVQTVVKLCRSAEIYFDYRAHHEDLMGEAFEEEVALSRAPSSLDLNTRPAPFPSPLRKIIAQPQRGPAAADGGLDPLGSPGFASADGASPTYSGGALSTDRRVSSFGVLPSRVGSEELLAKVRETGAPYMSKVESIASSAVRTAEKIDAGLIMVLAETGRTVSLVAKYRPPMPILAVVVPTLRSSKLGWMLEGKFLARQCLIMRGVRPMLSAPMSGGSGNEGLMSEAIASAHSRGLLKPLQYVVCIMSQQGSLVVKVMQANESGTGIAKLKSSADNPLMRAAAAAANQMRVSADGDAHASPFLSRNSMSMKGAGATVGGAQSTLVPTMTEEYDYAG